MDLHRLTSETHRQLYQTLDLLGLTERYTVQSSGPYFQPKHSSPFARYEPDYESETYQIRLISRRGGDKVEFQPLIIGWWFEKTSPQILVAQIFQMVCFKAQCLLKEKEEKALDSDEG